MEYDVSYSSEFGPDSAPLEGVLTHPSISEEIEVTLRTFGGLYRVQRRLIPSLIRGTWASLGKPGLQVSLSLSSPDGQ